MPEWAEFWPLMAFVLAIPMLMMAGVWVISRVLNNAGIVDIFWSYGFIPVALACALLGGGDVARSFVLVLMVRIVMGVQVLVIDRRVGMRQVGRIAARPQRHGAADADDDQGGRGGERRGHAVAGPDPSGHRVGDQPAQMRQGELGGEHRGAITVARGTAQQAPGR